MRMTINDKSNQESVTFIQGEPDYKGRAINSGLVLMESLLNKVNNVIFDVYINCPKALITECELLLPDEFSYFQRQSTKINNDLFNSFIGHLEEMVGGETIGDIYSYNELNFVARKVYSNEKESYYKYKIAAFVSDEFFRDEKTKALSGRKLLDFIVDSWAAATNLDYPAIQETFLNQKISSYYMHENNHEDYMDTHRKLSKYALAGVKVDLGKEGDLICSKS